MPTISQLTAVSSVQDTDQIPIYSTDNGDARKASASVFKEFLTTNITLTNPILIAPDLGTPVNGDLINCYGLTIAGGGTGASTANGALTNFGGTTIGKAVFTAATTTDAQNAIGATTVGKGVFTAASENDAQNAIGATTVGKAVLVAATAADGRTAIGAAESGANDDITSLAGLTTPLGAAQGGTGLSSSGTVGNVLTADGLGGWTPSAPVTGGLGAATTKTANYTAIAGDVLACNTITTGAFTVTLPSSPVAGQKPIIIFDSGTTDTLNGFATNNLTVSRNGSTIHTLAEDVIFSTKGVSVIFEYISGTWRMRIG